MKNNKLLIFSFLGLLLGLCLTYNLWFTYFSIIVILCIIFIKNKYEKKESIFLIKLFLISLFLRIFVVAILRPFIILHGNGIDVFGDGFAYGLNSFFISETLKKDLTILSNQIALNSYVFKILPIERLFIKPVTWMLSDWIGKLPPVTTYQVSSFGYFLSMLYYFFGFKPILGSLVNCLFGSALGLCIYSITKKISNSNTISRVAAVLTSFFPSLFLWSISNARDTIFIFLNTIIILLLIKTLKEKKWFMVFYLPLLFLIQVSLRPNFLFPLLIYYGLIGSIMIWLLIIRNKVALIFIGFLTFFLILFPMTQQFIIHRTGALSAKTQRVIGEKALGYHWAQVREGGSYYKILKEPYYYVPHTDIADVLGSMPFMDILIVYLKGVGHLLFEPSPFKINNFSKLIYYPQIILIYFLFIFFFLGLLITLRRNILAFFILFSYLLVFSSTIGLTEANVGILVRHRDILTPIFIVFVSIGLLNFFGANKSNYEIV